MTVTHLIFDLDNTLYPETAAMDSGITHRMIGYVAAFLQVDYDTAVKRRAQALPHYSSTLEWLKCEAGLTDTEAYFAAVHPDEEVNELEPAPGLRPLLLSLSQQKSVLTNAPREHAERVLAFLGVQDLFDTITDIRDCGLRGKPYADAYETALSRCGGTAADTLFLDDHRKYTDGFAAVGGTAVQVGNSRYSKILDPAFAGAAAKNGRTLHIASVYELPALLAKLAAE